MTEQADDNPLEQLIELFVYAPIGMLYDYPDVLPQLVKKGRSQVQLAKFFGQMAARQQSQAMPDGAIAGAGAAGAVGAQAADNLARFAARFITELGSQIGLAPPSGGPAHRPESAQTPGEESTSSDPVDGAAPSVRGRSSVSDSVGTEPARTARLPIAGYDNLTAKEIIRLLDDLTHDQLVRVENHERGNRNRKTVLGKIERLLS